MQIARESGLVKMGTLAIDGTKVKANASKHKAMSFGRMQEEERRLRREIRALTQRSKDQDAAEDVEFGPDFRGDELPEELRRRESRLAVIRAAKQRLEERKAREAREEGNAPETPQPKASTVSHRKPGRPLQHPPGKPKPKDQENFTDPDSRIMKEGSGAFQQCYNAQIAVDEDAQIVIAAEVGQSAADVGRLLPMLDQAVANVAAKPDVVLADAGYRSEENFRALERRKIQGLIPLGREGRTKAIASNLPATRRMQQRLQGRRARRRYKKRKHIVEPAIGWIKRVLGFRTFCLRSLGKVRGEWNLVTLALNVRRMNQKLAWT